MLSIGSFITSVLASLILGLYCYFYMKHSSSTMYRESKVISVILFIAGCRLLLPFNLVPTYNLKITVVLPTIADFLYRESSLWSLEYFQILITVSFAIGVVVLITHFTRAYLYKRDITKVSYTDDKLSYILSECINDLGSSNNITARYIDAKVSPFIIGIIHPVIFVPSGIFCDNEMPYVLKHEIIHYQRKDLLVVFFIAILQCLFWWNPFIKLIRRQLGHSLEFSNDMSLVETFNLNEKIEYVECIAKAVRATTSDASGVALSFAKSSDPVVLSRVKNILNSNETKSHQSFITMIIISIIVLGVSFTVMPEPSHPIPDEILESTITLEKDRTYFVDKGTYYDIYVDNEFFCTMENMQDDFKDFKVYKDGNQPTPKESTLE
ncbi:MAG: M56 family metallopeptidase [Clostridiales bacterium]|nr:M56 family metallopeptidase [Clostridiales bacterium]